MAFLTWTATFFLLILRGTSNLASLRPTLFLFPFASHHITLHHIVAYHLTAKAHALFCIINTILHVIALTTAIYLFSSPNDKVFSKHSKLPSDPHEKKEEKERTLRHSENKRARQCPSFHYPSQRSGSELVQNRNETKRREAKASD